MAETWDNKAIKGSDLQAIITGVESDINTKQDALDVEIDVANKRLKLNNVAFTVTPAE